MTVGTLVPNPFVLRPTASGTLLPFMTPSRLGRIAVGAALLVWTSCGTPGAPQPPSLQLPRPVEALAAGRKAERVTLYWTAPAETTDGAAVKGPMTARICRSLEHPMAQCQALHQLDNVQPGAAMEWQDHLSADLQREHVAGTATYAVEMVNLSGRGAGLSNQVRVPLAPTLAPPSDFAAQATPEGPLLTFSGEPHEHALPQIRHRYRIYRRAEGTDTEVVVGEVSLRAEPRAELRDLSFEWEKTYLYWITVVTAVPTDLGRAEIEGDDSQPVRLLVHDSFPPATPTGVQAVFSGREQQRFVDLTWAPNTESDLAGYNLYRTEEGGGAAVKINPEAVRAPAFRDAHVQAGRRCTYSVSAVDLRGNESGRSEAASELVPAP